MSLEVWKVGVTSPIYGGGHRFRDLPSISLLLIFCSVDAEGSHHTEEDFRIIHGAMEVFRARAAGIQENIIGGMAFLGIVLRSVGRHQFSRVARMDTSRICFGGSMGYLMVFYVVPVTARAGGVGVFMKW